MVDDERKTQTRRVARPGDRPYRLHFPRRIADARGLEVVRYDRSGDQAWVVCAASRLNRKGRRYLTWYNGLVWPKYSYGVQPSRNAASICMIRFTVLSLEHLWDIDEVDILEEGFDSLHEFRHTWDAIQQERAHLWDANPLVWALTFRKVKKGEYHVRQRTDGTQLKG